MEKDFHYYVIYALAKTAGFTKKVKSSEETEAKIISYASQYVDDNCDREYLISRAHGSYRVKMQNRFPAETQPYFYPLITQSVDIKCLDQKVQYYVFMPFHFLPGDYENVKINGMTNPYCTTRNSKNANRLMDDALKSGNSYRIGIALHTYADTWAHERFTGFEEKWNKVLEWYKDFKALAPDIGHADLWHIPDQISKTWKDHRFEGEVPIKNKERALQAAENIYNKLSHKKKGPPWADIKTDLEKIIYLDSSIDDADEKKVYDERRRRINNFVQEPLDYDKDKWMSEVIEFDFEELRRPYSDEPSRPGEKELLPINIRLKENFQASNWYAFHVAARIHQSEVIRMTASL